MLRRYSPSATEPAPRVSSSMAKKPHFSKPSRKKPSAPVRSLLANTCATWASLGCATTAKSNFDPFDFAVVAQPSLAHVAQVFAFSDRTGAEGFFLDGFEKCGFFAGLNASCHQIAHAV